MTQRKLPPDLRPQTLLVHGGTLRSGFDETSEAVFMTSGFVYGSAEEAEAAFLNDGSRYVYSRFRNPTVSMFEARLAALEGAERGFAAASGMAAVFATLAALVRAGDRVVAPRALFGSCLYILTDILPRWGVETVLVDGTDLDQWREALAVPTAAALLESPSNPTLEVLDLRAICDLAHGAGARVIVDNVFATPILQKPLELGADIVVYSTTKHIDGQGRSLGGAILCGEELAARIAPFLRHTGPAMSPFNAWLLLKGLETIALRVRAQAEAAAQIAAALESCPGVRRVLYPGLPSHPQHALAKAQMESGGPMLAFEVEGGKAAAFATLNALRIALISNNLGDSKSLITHPTTTTHQRLTDAERAAAGITDGMLRFSVGLEDPQDLIADLTQAVAAGQAGIRAGALAG